MPVYVINAGPDANKMEIVHVVGTKEKATQMEKFFSSGINWTFNRENNPIVCNCAECKEYIVETDDLTFIEKIFARISSFISA